MKETKDAFKKQEQEMLNQFNVEELEERLEMRNWSLYTEDVPLYDECGNSTSVVGATCTINF